MRKNYLTIILVVGLLIFGVYLFSRISPTTQTQPTPIPTTISSPTATSSAILGIQTKTTGCQIQGPLPDKECTPGAVFPNVTKDQICTSGYASSVRNVPISEKNLVYLEYGLSPTGHQSGEYEVDHLISLELGGSNDISNLFPEAAEPRPGYHEKDKLENYLHQQVCSGTITLQQAQQEIAGNWLEIYNQIPH